MDSKDWNSLDNLPAGMGKTNPLGQSMRKSNGIRSVIGLPRGSEPAALIEVSNQAKTNGS